MGYMVKFLLPTQKILLPLKCIHNTKACPKTLNKYKIMLCTFCSFMKLLVLYYKAIESRNTISLWSLELISSNNPKHIPLKLYTVFGYNISDIPEL